MKPYAWVVKKGNLPYLCYSKEEAIWYHKHIGSKEPITELYERTTHCEQTMNQHKYIPPIAPAESKVRGYIIVIACLAVFALWGVLLALGV